MHDLDERVAELERKVAEIQDAIAPLTVTRARAAEAVRALRGALQQRVTCR